MKPKTVGYSESHEYVNSMGLKVWVKNWYEVELDSGDSPDECHEHCKNKVQSWNEEKTSQQEFTTLTIGQQSYTQPKDPEQSIVDDIATVTDIKVLDSYKLIANKKGGRILEAYNQKLQSLQK